MKYLNIIIIFSVIFTGCLSGGSGGISFGGRSSGGSSSSNSGTSATASDTTAPTVTNVNSNTAAATYGVGAVIDVRITFSEAVTVTGTPVITLETGTTDRNASYASGSGSTELVFNYTVQASDSSSDLTYTATTSLALSGGTIKDAAGNNATLTLVAPAAAGSLGANEAIVIDGASYVIQVATSDTNTCALLSTGDVRCWGDGVYTGNANNIDIGDDETPASAGNVNVGGSVVQLANAAGGGSAMCALLATGALRCWGNGSFGVLGYGNSDTIGDDETPASVGDVSVGGTVIQVAMGEVHTCVLLSDGTVKCWGAGFDGRLGYGNTNTIGDDELPSTVGVVDLGGAVAIQIAVGGAHNCALLSDGTVKCWGGAGSGQLGYGNMNPIGDNELPSAVGTINVGGTVRKLFLGDIHSCALLDDGNITCWGENSDGQLGYGNTNNIGDDENPNMAGTVNLGGSAVLEMSLGVSHTCALLVGGTVKCWGAATSGQTGYGNTTIIGDDEMPNTVGVVNVGGTAIQISSGDDHTCVLLDNGNVRCWGRNDEGRLGYGHTNAIGDNELPSSAGNVAIGGSQAVIQVSLGAEQTCALLVTGKVRCWGRGDTGLLGQGNMNHIGDNELPSTIGDISLGADAIQVSAGGQHTCVLLVGGNVKCFGSGGPQLGIQSAVNIGDDELPSAVPNVNVGGTVIQITAGDSHTCALLATGTVRCWGTASLGELGYGNLNDIGDNEDPATAGDVVVGDMVVQIGAGYGHTCALLATGAVRCWGRANFGQLGYGNMNNIGDNENPSTAGDVSLGATVRQISVNNYNSCALLSDGNLRCWGTNAVGELGLGNTNNIGDTELPSSVGAINVGAGVRQVAVGGDGSICVLLMDGNVKCWGWAFWGALGYGNVNDIGDDETPNTVGNVNLGGSLVRKIAAGGDSTCAILENGSVKCWGRSASGQLGYGNTNTIGDDELPSSVGTVSVF